MSTITRLTVEAYEAMIASGELTKHDRLELIEGKLVSKMTKGGKHSASSGRTWRAIHCLVPAGWHVRIETPIRIPTRESEPEPDVSVVRGGIDDYEDLAPGPEDLALVVEVSESTLAADRDLAATYGGAGIPVYWLVNIPGRQLEVYAGGVVTILGEHQSVELVIDGQAVGTIAVASLLPRSR